MSHLERQFFEHLVRQTAAQEERRELGFASGVARALFLGLASCGLNYSPEQLAYLIDRGTHEAQAQQQTPQTIAVKKQRQFF